MCVKIRGEDILKSEVIEASVTLLISGKISFLDLLVFWVSVWLGIEIIGKDGIVVCCISVEENIAAEMNWGGQCYDYVFLGIPYCRQFGYVLFEDSSY